MDFSFIFARKERKMPLESKFERELIEQLTMLYPGCVILKNDAHYKQGFPDRLILFEDKWAAFEVKSHKGAKRRPNQEYYVSLLNDMSYCAFVYPQNKEVFLHELQQALRPTRRARVPFSV